MMVDHRWGSARRSGMTVLGKVSVPKPINLPSQRYLNFHCTKLMIITHSICLPSIFMCYFCCLKVRKSRFGPKCRNCSQVSILVIFLYFFMVSVCFSCNLHTSVTHNSCIEVFLEINLKFLCIFPGVPISGEVNRHLLHQMHGVLQSFLQMLMVELFHPAILVVICHLVEVALGHRLQVAIKPMISFRMHGDPIPGHHQLREPWLQIRHHIHCSVLIVPKQDLVAHSCLVLLNI